MTNIDAISFKNVWVVLGAIVALTSVACAGGAPDRATWSASEPQAVVEPQTDSTAANGAAIEQSEDEFWQGLRVMGYEVEQYDTFTDMAAASDIVVRGRFRDINIGRRLTFSTEDAITYAAATIRVTRWGKASGARPEDLVVEFLLTAVDADSAVSSLKAALPESEMMLFLRAKGGAEAGRLRLVNMTGLAIETRGSLRLPLADEPASDDNTMDDRRSADPDAERRDRERSARPADLPKQDPQPQPLPPPQSERDQVDRTAQGMPHALPYASERASIRSLEALEQHISDTL